MCSQGSVQVEVGLAFVAHVAFVVFVGGLQFGVRGSRLGSLLETVQLYTTLYVTKRNSRLEQTCLLLTFGSVCGVIINRPVSFGNLTFNSLQAAFIFSLLSVLAQ